MTTEQTNSAPAPDAFPAAIWALLLDVADRKGKPGFGPWEDGNGGPMQDDADAAIAWIKARDSKAPAPAPEPVAWGLRRDDGLILDVICPEEHASFAGDYTVPLYAAPAPEVPAGMVLVPVEPTIAMLMAGDKPRISIEHPTVPAATWSAMLAAASCTQAPAVGADEAMQGEQQ